MDANALDEAYKHFEAGPARRCGCELPVRSGGRAAKRRGVASAGRHPLPAGPNDEACELLQRATDSPNATPEMHNNYGAVSIPLAAWTPRLAPSNGRWRSSPDYPDALNNLGVIYRDMRKFDAAVAAFRRAIDLNPDLPSPNQSAQRLSRRGAGLALRDDG